MVEPTWFHKSPVISTGASGTRTLADHLGARFNVLDFGAVGNGTTDDSAAIQAALSAANAAGGGVVYLPGSYTFRKADTSATLTMYSNTTIMGDGDSSILFHDDTVTNPRRDLLSANNTSNICFRDFKILGTANLNGSNVNISQCLGGGVISNLRVENVTFEGLRFMSTAFSRVSGGIFTGCRLYRCMRDGIRCTHSYNIIVDGNYIESVSDDCVALHCLDSLTEPAAAGFVVTNNTFVASQTVKILGGKRVVISNNTFTRMLRQPILVELDYGLTEGATPLIDIDISHNVIQDTFGGFGINDVIKVGSHPYSAGGLATQPGVNSTPYAYNWANNIDTGTVPNVGAACVRIENNTISRTLPPVAKYSDYGFGLMYDWNFTWGYDPAITDASYGCHGIVVLGPVRGLRICGNIITSMGSGNNGIRLASTGASSYPDFIDTLIEGNILTDCPDIGISLTGGDANAARNLIIRNNIINQDPYFRNASHNADNTWTSGGAGPAIQTNANIKGLVITGNWFAHCGAPINPTMSGVAYIRDNYVLCDPASIADNAANRGVRNLTPQFDFIHIKYDGVPTSPTFGEISSMPLTTAASIPTTGWYAAGHFVKAAGLGADIGGGITHGWLRLTTGTGHVSGTDWQPVGIPNYNSFGVMAIRRNDSATNAQFTMAQAGTGDTIQVFELVGVRAWILGIDNSDADAFKLASANAGFASGVALTVSTAGDLTVTGTTTAPTFVGALTGNASTATALSAGADRTKLDGYQAAIDLKAPLASPTFTGTATAPQLRGVAALDLGSITGTSTPYIDFNSGATAVDYDSRIIASGGTGVAGQGTLTYQSGSHVFNGRVLPNISDYVDDAAAAAAGVPLGALYRTGNSVKVRIV